MTTVWERVEDALSGIDLPKAANQLIAASGQPLPDAYLAYFLISSVPEQHAEDQEVSRSYHVQISYYSRSGLAGLPDITGAMTAAGWTCGPTRELPYNRESGHHGLALEFWFYEEE